VAGQVSKASFAGRDYSLPIDPLAEELLEKLVDAGFDLTYSQDAVLGHSFAAVYEWVIEGRQIPVIPLFVNTYLPPLPTARRCAQLGRAIRSIVESGDRRVAIVASGGMSHYPGTWKYPQPAYDFDWWAIAHMERGNFEPLLNLSNEQLDEVGNTEMLPWMILFGAIGSQRGELLTYQPTWHHGHAVMRFIPNRTADPDTPEPVSEWKFQNAGGYQFYKHPDPAVYRLNKVLYDLRHSQALRRRLFEDTSAVAADYGLTETETGALALLKDENIDILRSLKSHPLVDAGAHPLGMLMSLVVVQAEQRRLRREAHR
jgi:2,3-dihydroxyphenylpropionate 1,2-dioxygenase